MLSTAQADPTPWLPLPEAADWLEGNAPAETERANNYYRARYYDPKIGRFISEDPIGFRGGINFYAYVENNPTNWIDPWGRLRNPPSNRVPGSGLGPPPNIGEVSSQMAADFVGRPPGIPGGLRDKEDALRHCLASCWYTMVFGSAAATALGNILESKSMAAGTQTTGDITMDLTNNAVGRQCAAGATSPQDCLTRCHNEFLLGNLLTNVPAGGPYP
jgi:RHS repeat-associated protein